MAYCVMVAEKLLIDTTYEHEELSKMHYLSFYTGDYDEEEFHHKPDGLKPSIEFTKYPEARTVKVAIQPIRHLH